MGKITEHLTDNLTTETATQPDNVTDLPKPKKYMTLADVRKIWSQPKDKRPDIMPRYVSIGNVVYDMSKDADRTIILRALYNLGVDISQPVRKRNPAPIMPIAHQTDKNKRRVTKAARKMSRARG